MSSQLVTALPRGRASVSPPSRRLSHPPHGRRGRCRSVPAITRRRTRGLCLHIMHAPRRPSGFHGWHLQVCGGQHPMPLWSRVGGRMPEVQTRGAHFRLLTSCSGRSGCSPSLRLHCYREGRQDTTPPHVRSCVVCGTAYHSSIQPDSVNVCLCN